VTVTAERLPPGREFQLVWVTAIGTWKVTDTEYHGRDFTPVAYEIARVRTDFSGRFTSLAMASSGGGTSMPSAIVGMPAQSHDPGSHAAGECPSVSEIPADLVERPPGPRRRRIRC
jgi:hypothetical protein